MSTVNAANVAQYTYARAYGIQVTPINGNEGEVIFLADGGITTAWPCLASLYDTAEEAFAALLTATLPSEYDEESAYLRVVFIKLDASVEEVKRCVAKPKARAA